MTNDNDSILVFEYFTASGVSDKSIISEAEELIFALLNDLKDFPVNLIINKSYENAVSKFDNVSPILIDENIIDWLEKNASQFKKAIFISAEDNNNLYNITKILEDNGVKTYTSSADACLKTSNKFVTYEELFNIVQQRVKATRRQKNQYLYKGLVVCAACKQPMITHCAKGSSGRFYLYYQCQTCGQKQIPENLITRECLPKFEQILKEKSTMTNIEVLKEKYTDMSEVLSNITEAMVRDGIDNELFASLYHLRNKDIKELDFCIRKLRAGWKNVSFMDLPFHEKREFLLGRVSKIKCDYISKAIDLELKEEDDGGEEVDLEDEDE